MFLVAGRSCCGSAFLVKMGLFFCAILIRHAPLHYTFLYLAARIPYGGR